MSGVIHLGGYHRDDFFAAKTKPLLTVSMTPPARTSGDRWERKKHRRVMGGKVFEAMSGPRSPRDPAMWGFVGLSSIMWMDPP